MPERSGKQRRSPQENPKRIYEICGSTNSSATYLAKGIELVQPGETAFKTWVEFR